MTGTGTPGFANCQRITSISMKPKNRKARPVNPY